jgi:threonine-phosphate decarboxylase
MIFGHGDDRWRYGGISADFSSNVPGGIDHSALWSHLTECMEIVEHYPEPEPRSLEAELARGLGLSPGEVMVTNGATEAIYLTAQLLAGMPPRAAAVVEPTFSEYGDACRIHGMEVKVANDPYSPPAGCGSLWCCNPNNPTGRLWDRNRLLKTVDTHTGTIFVIDQSYESFTRGEVITATEAAARPNLILVHSMTKHYAIPGLRLGYLTAGAAMCDRLRALKMPWSVNALAIEAGMFLLENGVPGPSLETMLTEAARLAGALRSMGIFHPHPTDTHFMLVETDPGAGTAAELKQWLAGEHGILIRNADNFRGLSPHHFRIAAQSPSDNYRLINTLTQWSRR